ncbi:MAG: NAD-dependent epimerase/dehydratase family protein, partial [Nanoarchaeota archaeon]
KACQQLVALSFANNFKLPVKIVACSNIYGPGDYNFSRVVPKSISRLSKGQKAMLWKDSAEQIREFVYVDDVADAFVLVGKKGKAGEIYCCGGTEYTSIGEFMKKICTLMGKDSERDIEVVERPVELMELQEQFIDSTKLRSLGWTPKYTLEKGLEECIKFYSGRGS